VSRIFFFSRALCLCWNKLVSSSLLLAPLAPNSFAAKEAPRSGRLSQMLLMFLSPLVFLFVASLVPPASAFKPNEEFGHGYITRAGIRATGLLFCPESIDNLVESNLNTDFGREFFQPPAHCDDELIQECSARITGFRDEAVTLFRQALNETDDLSARTGAIEHAWALLGRALHTLQDFYAHSNWVNLGNNAIHPDMGQRVLGRNPSPNEVICLPDRSTHVGTTLSTGYFPIALFKDICTDEVPEGKCRHGVVVKPFYDCPAGLNNDEPGRPNFTRAQELAVAATIRFLSDVHTLLATAEPQELYLGSCGVSMYYIIDVTPTMGPDIEEIIAFIRNQTQSVEAAEVAR
jgi:von Willebrand factor A domain-containing protein 7